MLRQTAPGSPEPRACAPFQPRPRSSRSGRLLGTFRPRFLPVLSPAPLSGAAWGGHSGPWRHLCTLLSPGPCSHPSALPGAGPAFPPHLPRCWPRPASARSRSRTLTAPLWPWPVHALGLSHRRGHQAVLKRPAVLLGCLLGLQSPLASRREAGVWGRTHTCEHSGPAGFRAPHCPGVCGRRPLQSGRPSVLAAAGLRLVSWGQCEGGARAQTLLSAASRQMPAMLSGQECRQKGGRMLRPLGSQGWGRPPAQGAPQTPPGRPRAVRAACCASDSPKGLWVLWEQGQSLSPGWAQSPN